MNFEDDAPRDPALMEAAERRFLSDRRTLYGKVDLKKLYEEQQRARDALPIPDRRR